MNILKNESARLWGGRTFKAFESHSGLAVRSQRRHQKDFARKSNFLRSIYEEDVLVLDLDLGVVVVPSRYPVSFGPFPPSSALLDS
jgi:hypothetical protein